MQDMTTDQKRVLSQLKQEIKKLTPATPPVAGVLKFVNGDLEVVIEWADSTIKSASIWTEEHQRASIRKMNPSWVVRIAGFEQKFPSDEDLQKFLGGQV